MSVSGVDRSDPSTQGGSQMTRTGQRLSAWITVIGFGVTLSACASSGPPQAHVYAYPARGQTAEQQSRDTYECQVWAKQQSGFDPGMDTAKGAGVGAVIGALGGAAAGAAIGSASGHAGTGAAIGAAAGGLGGAGVGAGYNYSKSREGYDQAFSACMSGRGYSIR
jgi:hypothetical protein